MSLISDVLEKVVLLLQHNHIDALLIGGFAVNYYGYTRNTLDVDFMIALEDVSVLCHAMRKNGFTNVEIQENVIFFNQPGNAVRIDFLKVDQATMQSLLLQSIDAEFHGKRLKVPGLLDLLAMKLFSLNANWDRRVHKDLPDIANLAIIHEMDILPELEVLCDKFADPHIYQAILHEIELLREK